MRTTFKDESRRKIWRAWVQRGRSPKIPLARRFKRVAAVLVLVVLGAVVYFRLR